MSRKQQILIVDDTYENLKLATVFLRESGFDILATKSGKQALNVLEKVSPDIILLDVRMPEMDGFETCRRLKAWEKTKDIPVIFMTAAADSSSPAEKVKGLMLGAVDYISKPIQLEEVLARVKTHLHLNSLTKQLQEQNALLQHEIFSRQQTELILQQEIGDRQQAEAALRESAASLRKHNRVLIELARNQALHQGDLNAAIETITEATAHNIAVERVSVWLFDKTGTLLKCLNLFERSLNRHSQGVELVTADYPSYFQALIQEQLLVADEAHTDPKTSEFSESYLTPLGISSMLDAPIRLKGQTVGVVCLEHVGDSRYWTPEDQNFARSVANLVSLALEAQERKRAEDALRESEERWQLAIKGNNDGIWDWKINIGKTFISTRYKEILGYKNHEIVFYFDEWKRHVHPNDLERVIAATQDYLDQKSPYYHVEYRLRCKDGTYKWVMSRGQALWDEEGKPVRMVGSTKDISRRKRAEEKLRNSKAHLVVAQRVAHVGSWELDILTQKIIWSEEMFRIFGLDSTKLEPTYAEYIQLIHPDDRAVWEQFVGKAIADGTFYEVDFRIVRPDGEIRYVEGRGETIANEAGQVKRLFGTVIDITERKQAEEALRASEAREREKAQELELALSQLKRTQAQLIQAEKMSSLGRTIAGVAHEINNPVGFISCNLTHARAYFQDLLKLMELYQQTYPKPTPAIERLTKKIELNFLIEDWVKLMDSMQMGSERIRQIVLSLRNFSRLDEKELKPVDIHEGIDNTLLILQHQMRSVGVSKAGRDSGLHQAIEVIKDYGQLPKVTCYASQLNQVFMNLLSNAIDALKTQPSPRKITISTSVASHHWSVVNGNKQQTTNYVVIRIADNGPGISEEVLPKIFDPFFTTKPVGSGTGLGLSISYQIVVETHKGQIRCISALGQGTEMIIEIPVNCDSEAGRHQAEG